MVCHFATSGVFVPPETTFFCPAKKMGPRQRQGRPWRPWQARRPSAGWPSSTRSAASSSFLYRQAAKAEQALEAAFSPRSSEVVSNATSI